MISCISPPFLLLLELFIGELSFRSTRIITINQRGRDSTARVEHPNIDGLLCCGSVFDCGLRSLDPILSILSLHSPVPSPSSSILTSSPFALPPSLHKTSLSSIIGETSIVECPPNPVIAALIGYNHQSP